jgi:Zn-dependent metalloprotease
MKRIIAKYKVSGVISDVPTENQIIPVKVKRTRQSKKNILLTTGKTMEEKVKMFQAALTEIYGKNFTPKFNDTSGKISVYNKNNKEIDIMVTLTEINVRSAKCTEKRGIMAHLNCGKDYKGICEYVGKFSISMLCKHVKKIADNN